MLRLTTLGNIDLLRGDGGRIGSVLQQPKRLALLVYLALEGRTGPVRRDTLLGVFWPERGDEAARQNLRQSLYYLRRSLGPDVVVAEGDDVALAPGALRCDAVAVLDALDRGEPAAALELLAGELLPGFFVSDGPELEGWLEARRAEIRRRGARAAWTLAEAEAARGAAVAAASWGRRAASLALEDEAAVRRLLELLVRLGDHAGALEAYRALEKRLEREHGAAPSERTRAVMAPLAEGAVRVRSGEAAVPVSVPEGVRVIEEAGGPAQSVPPPRAEGAVPPPAPVRSAPSAPRADAAPRAPRRHPRLRRAGEAVATLVLLAGIFSFWGNSRSTPAGAAPVELGRPRVVVDAIEGLGEAAELDALAGAAEASLLRRLSRAGSLEVVPAGVAPAGLERAGERPVFRFRAGVVRSGGRVRVDALLVDAATGATVETAVLEYPAGEPIALADDAAAGLAAFVRRGLGAEMRERRWIAHAPSPRVRDLVLQARRDGERADSLRADGVAQAALVAYLKADSLFAEAEAEAPDWAEPAVQRAVLAYRRMWLLAAPPFGDRAGARTAVRKGIAHADGALAIRPDDAAALEIRGVLRHWRWILMPDDSLASAGPIVDRIEADLRRALELNPGAVRAWNVLSMVLFMRGRFGESYWAAERALTADAYAEEADEVRTRLFSAAVEVGDTAAARRWCEELKRHDPEGWLASYCELHLLALGSASGEDVARAASLVEASGGTPQGAMFRPRFEMLAAVVKARAGRRDAAHTGIEAARAAGAGDPELLQLEAWARLALGEPDSAAVLLARFVDATPRAGAALALSPRFRELEGHPILAQALRR